MNNKSEIIKQKEENDRMLLRLEVVIGVLSTVTLIMPLIFGPFLNAEEWVKELVMCSGIVPALFGYGFALKIEQVAGYYECKHCKHRYVPTFKDVVSGPHMGRSRYMKCPECGENSWQKKVVEQRTEI